MFRVMRELEAVKQESALLQDQMRMVKEDVQKVCIKFYENDLLSKCIMYLIVRIIFDLSGVFFHFMARLHN